MSAWRVVPHVDALAIVTLWVSIIALLMLFGCAAHRPATCIGERMDCPRGLRADCERCS